MPSKTHHTRWSWAKSADADVADVAARYDPDDAGDEGGSFFSVVIFMGAIIALRPCLPVISI